MNPVLGWLLANTACALALAAAALLCERLARPRPAVLHALWVLVLLRLCWPPGLGVAVPLPLDARPAAAPAAAPAAGALEPLPQGRPPRPAAPARTASPAVAPATAPASRPAPRIGLWPALWLGGSSAVLAILSAGVLRGRRRFLRLPPAPGWLAAEVAALAQRIGVAPPQVVDDPFAPTPCVWALGRVRLVACADALGRLDPGARAAVLAHELAHLRRRDHWWLRLELLLMVAFFWHPLFWLARARLREQAELACDAWALWAAPQGRFGYAEALVAALVRAHPAPSLPVLAARPSARRAFERRLSMILHEVVPRRPSRWSLAGLCALAVVLGIAPASAQRPREEPAPQVEIRIDGRRLESLPQAERERLLRRLGLEGEALQLVLRARELEGGGGVRAGDMAGPPRADREQEREEQEREEQEREREREQEPAGRGRDPDVPALVQEALEEARREIRSDPDLRGLDITEDVLELVETALSGRDFRGALDTVIDRAIAGAGRMAQRGIERDADLRRLGIAGDLGRLVGDLTQDAELREGLRSLAGVAFEGALNEARAGILADEDLRRLGVAGDLAGIVGNLAEGRLDLQGLGPVIERAVRAAMRQADDALRERERESETEPGRGERRERRRAR